MHCFLIRKDLTNSLEDHKKKYYAAQENTTRLQKEFQFAIQQIK